MPDPADDETRRHRRGERYEGSVSRAELKAAEEKAAEEARKDMIIEQVIASQEQTAATMEDFGKTLAKINTDLATGRGVMDTIKTQAKQSIKTAEAATIAAHANTQALMDHMNKHSTTSKSKALDKKSESWVRPIMIQVGGTVLGALATAAVLGGIYASFFMKNAG